MRFDFSFFFVRYALSRFFLGVVYNKDNEVYGDGKSYTAEFWQYDSRLGRRWNIDPKPNTSISPYATFANNPILFVDVKGDTVRYNSFKEKVDVLVARIFSKAFRSEFKSLKKSEKTYTYRRIEDAGYVGVDDVDGSSYPSHFTINYSKQKKDIYGRSSYHALFEETFHAVDYQLGRSSSMIIFSKKRNVFVLGHRSDDKSHEARAWQFAALNAPFYKSSPKLVDEHGVEYYLLSSIISQIRSFTNRDNQQNIDMIIGLLYKNASIKYQYVGEENSRIMNINLYK